MSRGVSKSVRDGQARQPLARLAPISFLLGVGSCASVLGIEELHEEPRPGTGGASSGAANAGGSNQTGGTQPVGGRSGKGGTNPQDEGGASTGGWTTTARAPRKLRRAR